MTIPPSMTTARMLANVLNQRLVSPLRVEIVSAETIQATGQVNLTAFAEAVATQLAALEQLPLDALPKESVYEQDGLRLVWLTRSRRGSEADAPTVVVEPLT